MSFEIIIPSYIIQYNTNLGFISLRIYQSINTVNSLYMHPLRTKHKRAYIENVHFIVTVEIINTVTARAVLP